MKITRTAEQYKKYKDKLQKIINKATEGCDKCPCCDSKWHAHDYEYKFKFCWQLFTYTTHRVDKYLCKDCGAKWRSDPYPYGSKIRLILGNREEI